MNKDMNNEENTTKEETLNKEQYNCEEECSCHDENHDGECNCSGNPEESSDHHSEKHKKHKAEKNNDEFQKQISELEEKVLREKAELINYRKRKEDEVSKLLKYSNEEIVKQLLPIVDNFERAIKMDDDNLQDEVSKFLEGFKMIYCNLTSILESFEVKAIDGNNKPFDPTYHQAVLTEVVEGVEPGMVLEVLQKGYLLKDRIIRPAMVKVSE